MDSTDTKLLVSVKTNPFEPAKAEFVNLGLSIREILRPYEEHDVCVLLNGEPWTDLDYVPLATDFVTVSLIPGTGGPGEAAVIAAVVSVVIGVGTYFWLRSILPEITDTSGSRANSITGSSNQVAPYQPIPVILGRRRVVPALAAQPYSEVVGDDQYYRVLYCLGYGPLKVEDLKIGETPLDEFAAGDFVSDEGIVPQVSRGQIVRKVPENKYYEARKTFTSINLATANYSNTADWRLRTDLVEVQIKDYYENFDDITLFPNGVTQEEIGVDLTWKEGSVSPEWTTRTTADDITEIGLEFVFPQGLYRFGSKGDRNSCGQVLQIEIRKEGESDWYTPVFFDALNPPAMSYSTAPQWDNIIHGSLDEELFSGGALEGEWQPTPSQTGEIPSGAIFHDAPTSSYYYNPTILGMHPQAPERVKLDSSNTLNRSSIQTLVKTNGNFLQSLWFERNTTSGFHVGRTIAVPKGKYDVRVRKLIREKSDGSYDNRIWFNDVKWSNIKGVRNVNPVNHGGVVLIALKIRATDKINGAIDNFNCIATTVTPTWDTPDWNEIAYGGASNVSMTDPNQYPIAKRDVLVPAYIQGIDWQPTRNPAYLMRWLLQGPMNKRRVSDSRIDWTAFEEFRDWCDEEEFTFNHEIDYDSTLMKELENAAASSRGKFLFRNGLFSVVIDRDRIAPAMVFSDKNAIEIRSERQFNPHVAGFLVNFQNEDKDYVRDEFPVYANGVASSVDDAFEKFEVLGVTNYNQAYKLARYKLAELELRREMFTISTDEQGLRCEVGDWIKVQSKVLLIGQTSGRVKAVGPGNTLTFDEAVTFELGKTYGVDVKSPTFAIVHKSVTNPATSGTPTITTRTVTVNNTTNVQVGDLFVFGESGKESLDLRVVKVVPGANLSTDIICDSLAKPLFTLDNSPIPPFDSGITQPPNSARLPPPIFEYARATEYRYRDERGGVIGTVEIGYSLPSGINLLGSRVEVVYRRAGGVRVNWGSVETTSRIFEIPDLDSGDYEFGLRLVKGAAVSEFVFYSLTLDGFNGNAPPIPDVTGLELIDAVNEEGTEFGGRDAKFRWRKVSAYRLFEVGSEPSGADEGGTDNYFEDYLVSIYDSEGKLLRSENVKDNHYVYTYEKNVEDVGGPHREFTIAVVARGMENQLSKTPATLRVSNPPPELPTNLRVLPDLLSLEVKFDLPVDVDFSHTEIFISQTSGDGPIESNLVAAGPESTFRITKLADDTDLVGGMTYYVTIRPVDAFGPIGAPHVELSQYVDLFGAGDVDLTPPEAVTGLTATTHVAVNKLWTVAQIDLSWNAVTNIGIQNYYITYKEEGSSDTISVTSIDPNITLYPVNENSSYYITVQAVSIFGVPGPVVGTTVLAAGDTTPPGQVDDLTATGGLDKVIISWKNPEDEDWLQTELYRGLTSSFTPSEANRVYTGRGDVVVDDGAVYGTDYYYKVRTVDVSNNKSEFSDPVGPVTPIRIDDVNIDQYIQAAAIATQHIQPGAISRNVLSNEVKNELDNLESDIQDVNAAIVLEGGRITYSTVAPLAGDAVGKPQGATWWRRNGLGEVTGQWELVGTTWQPRALTNEVIASIDAGKITTGYINAGRIEARTITGPMLADGTIGTLQIGDSAITSAKIGTAQIKSANIEDGAIGTAKIGVAAIDTAQIADGAIKTAKIDDAAVVTAKIGELAVTGAKIASASIVNAHIVNLDASKITTGFLAAARIQFQSITGDKIATNTIEAGHIQATAIDGKTITGSVFRTHAGANQSKVQFDTTGISGWDASGRPSFTIKTDGSGGLGVAKDENGTVISPTQHAITWNSSGDVSFNGRFVSGTSTLTFPMFQAAFPGSSSWRVRVGNHNISGKAYQISYANGTNVRFGVWTNVSTGEGNVEVSGNITGSTITGSTITGSLIQTAASGTRVAINEASNNRINFYSGSTLYASIGTNSVTTDDGIFSTTGFFTGNSSNHPLAVQASGSSYGMWVGGTASSGLLRLRTANTTTVALSIQRPSNATTHGISIAASTGPALHGATSGANAAISGVLQSAGSTQAGVGVLGSTSSGSNGSAALGAYGLYGGGTSIWISSQMNASGSTPPTPSWSPGVPTPLTTGGGLAVTRATTNGLAALWFWTGLSWVKIA